MIIMMMLMVWTTLVVRSFMMISMMIKMIRMNHNIMMTVKNMMIKMMMVMMIMIRKMITMQWTIPAVRSFMTPPSADFQSRRGK